MTKREETYFMVFIKINIKKRGETVSRRSPLSLVNQIKTKKTT